MLSDFELLLALPANIRLSWQGLHVTNALAYLLPSEVLKKEIFIRVITSLSVMVLWQSYKTFFVKNKLACLSLVDLSSLV
jgi:hypothetical protein